VSANGDRDARKSKPMPSSSIRRVIAGGLDRSTEVANMIVFDVPSLTALADAGAAMHASATDAVKIVRRSDDVAGMGDLSLDPIAVSERRTRAWVPKLAAWSRDGHDRR
jgi:hypothetical protein